MKKITTFVILLLLSISVFSQNKPVQLTPPPPPPPPEIPDFVDFDDWGDLTVKKTANHQLVNNTKLSMIPPKGFSAINSMSGFSKGDNTMIIVMEVPQNIDKSISDLMADNPDFKKKGIVVKSRKKFTINGEKGAYLIGDNGVQCLQILTFGNSEGVVFLTGVCLQNEKTTQTDIKNSFKTVFYDRNISVNPLDIAKFTIDFEGNGLKFENAIMGMLYLFSPKDTTQNKGVFMITQVPNDGTSLDDIGEQLIAKFAVKGIEYNKVVSKSTIVIDETEALEQIIESRKSIIDPLMVTYIVTLKKENLAFAIMASGLESGEKTEEWYRKLVSSFKIKK